MKTLVRFFPVIGLLLLAGCTTYSVHVRTFPPTESAQVLIVSGGLVIHLGAR